MNVSKELELERSSDRKQTNFSCQLLKEKLGFVEFGVRIIEIPYREALTHARTTLRIAFLCTVMQCADSLRNSVLKGASKTVNINVRWVDLSDRAAGGGGNLLYTLYESTI